MQPQRRIFILLVMLGVFLSPSLSAKEALVSPASEASSVVSNFYTKLIEVMQSGSALGFSGRYKKLEPTLRATFNFPLMTRFAIGPLWTKASDGEQKQLVSAFSDFSVATYASRFTKYNGETFQVLGEKKTTDGVFVETRLTPKDGDPVQLNYLMKKDEHGVYRIVDVYVAGAISELATRREEFGSIVKRDGITALVNSLSAKSRDMGPS